MISIDGKTIQGSYDRNPKQSELHVVSTSASEHQMLLRQVKVAAKSNLITAIPALLKLLDISGCIITLDAMGTQKEIAREIIGHRTDSYDARLGSGHHRREHRQVWGVPVAAMGNLHQIDQWVGLKTIVIVKRVRHLWNRATREVMLYLSSLPSDAALISRAIRTHWGTENQLHSVLDITWGEDKSRIRRGHRGGGMALLRRLATSMLNQETSKQRSLKQKAKRTSMSPDYILTILAAGLATYHNLFMFFLGLPCFA